MSERANKLPVFFRVMHVDAAVVRAAGESKQLPAIALSSEYPVKRTGWFGETWVETLDHSPGAVVLGERAANGLPLLLDHSTREQIGRLRDVALGTDKILRGQPTFSRSAKGQEVQQDVLDEIRTDVSVGYRIHEMVLEKQDKDAGIDYYRVTKWEPLEGSLVAVPADPTVGVGRAEPSEATYPVLVRGLPSEVWPMEPTTQQPPAPAPAPAASGGDDRARDAKDVAALAKAHGMTDQLPAWIERGLTAAQVKDEILASKRSTAAPVVPAAQSGDKSVQLTDDDAKRYSLSRAILAMAQRAQGMPVPKSFETEISDEITKKRGDPQHGGLWIPATLPVFPVSIELRERVQHYFQRGALEVATASKGGELKFVEPGPFIDLLRNRMFIRALGARVLTGLQGDISFPRQATAASASWVPESPTADVGSSNLTLDSPDLAPKILQATTSYTRKLLAQGVVDIDMLVRDDFVAVHALAIDLAAIAGPGTSNQPTGVLNTSGIGSVTLGANGGVPIYDTFVDLETELAIDNADLGAMAYLTTPKVRGRMKKSAAISATTGMPVWFGSEVQGFRAEASNQVPANLTKGTSTTICHAILFGNWADLIVGFWGDFELIVDPYALKKRGDIEVTTYQMTDVTVRHPESFAACKDALP